MQEIGGYYGLEQLVNNEYYKNLLALNTGRNALLYVLKAKSVCKLYIPYYLCDSIGNMLKGYKYDFKYYHIDSQFMPMLNKRFAEKEYLFIVNYYGQLTDDKVINLKQNYGNIILDNTHAFFQKPLDGIDTIYSCRKFFGVPDGAYLSTNSILNEALPVDISMGRMKHILGRFEGVASDYYCDFQENDASLMLEPLKYMSKLTKNILGAVDYERVKEIRNENYVYLDNKLKKSNKLQLVTPEGAFAYPFYLENGIEVRKKLAKKKIYIPTLWPNVLEDITEGSIEYDYAANILPLPCDQRYGLTKLDYLIKNLGMFLS